MAGMSAAHAGCSMVRSMGYDLGCGEDDYRYANAKPYSRASFHPSDIGAYGTKAGTRVMYPTGVPPAAHHTGIKGAMPYAGLEVPYEQSAAEQLEWERQNFPPQPHWGEPPEYVGLHPRDQRITPDQLGWEQQNRRPQPHGRANTRQQWPVFLQSMGHRVVALMERDTQLSFDTALKLAMTEAGSDGLDGQAYLVADFVCTHLAPKFADMAAGRQRYDEVDLYQRVADGAVKYAHDTGHRELEGIFTDVATHIRHINLDKDGYVRR